MVGWERFEPIEAWRYLPQFPFYIFGRIIKIVKNHIVLMNL